MTIQRFDTGPRMSQVVVHGDTIYLAGVVANNAAGKSVTKQTQDVLATIDSHLEEGRKRQVEAAVGDDLYHRHEAPSPEMNAVWDGWVSAGNTPARATVEAKLASPQYNVEIMVIAAQVTLRTGSIRAGMRIPAGSIPASIFGNLFGFAASNRQQ